MRSHRTDWWWRLGAAALAAAVVVLGVEVIALERLEAALQTAEGALAAPVDPAAALQALDHAWPKFRTPRQRTRARDLAELAIQRAADTHDILRTLGTHRFERSRSQPYVFPTERVHIQASLQAAPFLVPWINTIRLGDQSAAFEGTPSEADFQISLAGEGETIRLEMTLGGPRFEKGVPTGYAIELLRDSHVPNIQLEVLPDDGIRTARAPENGVLVVEAGTGVEIAVSDHSGLSSVAVTVDGRPEPTALAGTTLGLRIPLSSELLRPEKGRIRREISVVAKSTIGAESRLAFTIDVRANTWNPIRRLRVGAQELSNERPTLVAANPILIEADLPSELANEIRHLSLRACGQKHAFTASATGAGVQLQVAGEGPTTIVLERSGTVLGTYRLSLDSTPPAPSLAVVGEKPIAPGHIDLAPNASLVLRVADEHGLDRSKYKVQTEGVSVLETLPDATSIVTTLSRHGGRGGWIEVEATDLAGNQVGPLRWSFDPQDRLLVRGLVRAESAEPDSEIPIAAGEVSVALLSRGRGSVNLRVRAEGSKEVLRSVPIVVTADRSDPISIPLHVREGEEGVRVLEIEGHECAPLRLRVDRRAPSFAWADRPSEQVDESKPHPLRGGAELGILVRDQGGLASIATTPNLPLRIEEHPEGGLVYVPTGQERPTRLVLTAVDQAGHRSSVTILLVAP